jgi:hypothetical protein
MLSPEPTREAGGTTIPPATPQQGHIFAGAGYGN